MPNESLNPFSWAPTFFAQAFRYIAQMIIFTIISQQQYTKCLRQGFWRIGIELLKYYLPNSFSEPLIRLGLYSAL